MKLHLLDMRSKIYGDCIVVVEGSRKILIDGGHPGDWKASGSPEFWDGHAAQRIVRVIRDFRA